jgi:hypothetical protein
MPMQFIKNATNLGLLMQEGLHITQLYSLTKLKITEKPETAFASIIF